MDERQVPEREHVRHGSPWGLCAAFMTQLPVSGALLSIVDRNGHRATVSATESVAARWDELELELGTGPLRDAMTDSAPQLIPDVAASSINPVIGAHFERLGIRALFAFPLTMGAATVGVAGLYRSRAGALTAESVSTALRLAKSVTIPAVREALAMAARDGEPNTLDSGPGLRREVHQATGMISAQLDISTSEAFARLRAYAIATERSITAVSREVVDRVLDFLDLD